MTSITQGVGPVVEGLARAASLLVVTQFDGTLAGLATQPSEAVPVPGSIEVLGALATLPATDVAVVSGRSLRDLQGCTSWPTSVELIGSHGLEWSSGLTMGLTREASHRLQRLFTRVREIATTPGVMLEPKPYGVAVHYRQADPATVLGLLARLSGAASDEGDVHVLPGRQVVELAVTPLADGWALDVLRQRALSASILFIGDDETGEQAFEVLGPHDVVMAVGSSRRGAMATLDSPAAVILFLECLYERRRTAVSSSQASPNAPWS